MGLLDDLRAQAEAIKEADQKRAAFLRGHVALVDGKLKLIYQYLSELGKQLNVIKPTNPTRYLIWGVAEFSDLPLVNYYINYRQKLINELEYFDYLTLQINWASPENILVQKTSSTDINHLQDFFWRYNIRFEYKEHKNDHGRIIRGNFTISSEIKVSVTIAGDYENEQISISAKNMTGFKDTELVIPAASIDDAFLEEFAKTLIGQPCKFSEDERIT
jgi:hypothetical protein